MLNRVLLSNYCRLIGAVTLSVSLITWWMDLADIVSVCIFCRTQRTALGLLGLIMLLPHYRYLTILLASAVACVGLNASAEHLFLQFKRMSLSWTYTDLAMAALLIMCLQLIAIFEKDKKQQPKNQALPAD